MQCEVCRNEQRIIALEKDSERNQQTHKEFFSKHEDTNIARAVTDTKIDQVITSVALLTRAVDKNNLKIEEMAQKPAKKWENLSWLLVTGVVSAILGYVLRLFTGGG